MLSIRGSTLLLYARGALVSAHFYLNFNWCRKHKVVAIWLSPRLLNDNSGVIQSMMSDKSRANWHLTYYGTWMIYALAIIVSTMIFYFFPNTIL